MRIHLNRSKKAHWAFKSAALSFGVLVLLSLALQKDQPIQAVTVTSAPLHSAHHSNDFSGPYDSDRVARIAESVAAPEYFVLPDHGGIAIETGWLAILGEDFGDAIDENTSLSPNLFWNISDGPVSIHIGLHRSITVECGGLLLILNNENATGDLALFNPQQIIPNPLQIIPNDMNAVGVICGNGYYACCMAGPPPVAVCVSNSITKSCTAGGMGATACMINFADP